jgi:GNAT superfamily N-acetyltransferase
VRAAARTTTDELVARALRQDFGVFERGAERVVRLDGATAILTPSLPTVPHLNTVFIHARLDADAVEALAAEQLAGLGNQRVVIDDEAHGGALRPELEARGWTAYGLRHLVRDGAAPPPEAEALAEEVPYGHVRGLRREWLSTADWGLTDAQLEEGLAGDDRMFTGTPPRAFAVFEQGRPVSYALLLDTGERDAMLEDVYTTPEARGRGLSTATIAAVLHAARAERREYVFVPTDAAGKASALYERLGFAAVCVQHIFARSV